MMMGLYLLSASFGNLPLIGLKFKFENGWFLVKKKCIFLNIIFSFLLFMLQLFVLNDIRVDLLKGQDVQDNLIWKSI